MASLVATPDPLTGSVLVELDRQLVIDSFTRVVAAGSWGSASEVGGAYTIAGGAASSFAVNGSVGQITTTTTGVSYRAFLIPTATDVDETVLISVGVNPVGASIDAGLMMRYQSATDTYYQARVRLPPGSGAATLSLQYVVAGVFNALTDEVAIPDFVVSASNNFHIRATISGNLIRARAWESGTAEPQTWLVETRHTDLTSGNVGVQTIRNLGNLSGITTVNFDDFWVLASVEPLTLFRVTPDGARVLVRGSSFYTEDPAGTAVLWDNEAPFDVDIFYILTSADSSTATLTSNIINLDSDGDVWLRDPYVPANNIVIEISDVPFDYCDETPRIMFTDLLGKVYANASGIFDVIDAQRPDTVSQTRKRYASTLVLTSKEAADVESIETIIAGGYPLLLSLPTVYQFGLPYGTDWVSIGDVESSPVGVDRRLPARIWTMPFRLSDAPADVDTGNTGGNGIGGGDATYDVLAASVIGLTYTSLAAAGFTFDDIAAGTGY